MFGERVARADLRRYRRRGPARTTRVLLAALEAEGIAGATVLDIGSGVGTIAHHLLNVGAGAAVLVEASSAYLRAAAEEGDRQGHVDRMSFHEGDFVALADDLPRATVVTLDRALCCYPDMPGLVTASTAACEGLYGLVYPRDTWWTRAGVAVTNLLVRFGSAGFRVYVHPTDAVERRIEAAGLRPVFHRHSGAWRVAVFRRPAPAAGPGRLA